MSYFALLNPNTGHTLHYRTRCSWSSINWFFRICKNCVGAFFSSLSSSKQWSSKSKTRCLRRQWRSLRDSRVRVSLLLIAVSTSRKFNFFWDLLCLSKPSTASMNDSTKSRGLEVRRKIGMAIRLEYIETNIGTLLPIQVVVSVFLKFSSGIQIDSKSKTARLLKRFWSSVYWKSNESSLSKSVSRSWYTLFGYICFICSLHLTKWRSKFPVFRQYVSQVGQRKAMRSAWMLSMQQIILIYCINWTLFLYFLMLRCASSPTIAPSKKSMSHKQKNWYLL